MVDTVNTRVTNDSADEIIEALDLKTHSQLEEYKNSLEIAKNNSYDWLPIGIDDDHVKDFIGGLKDKAFITSSDWRKKQLNTQIPRGDRAMHLSTVMSSGAAPENEKKAYTQFLDKRNKEHLAFGELDQASSKNAENCQHCKEGVEANSYCIRTPSHKEGAVWHPSCFCCRKCSELLADLLFCWDDKGILCVRHYGEEQCPRCAACDELIFAEKYATAMNKSYHYEHFCCAACKTSLAGTGKFLEHENKQYCITCFEDTFCSACHLCSKKIACDEKSLYYNELRWHVACFTCSKCSSSLVDANFALHKENEAASGATSPDSGSNKDKKLFCVACFDEMFAERCHKCHRAFQTGQRKVDYKDKRWHEDCFVCAECGTSLGCKEFVENPKQLDNNKEGAANGESAAAAAGGARGAASSGSCVAKNAQDSGNSEYVCSECYEKIYSVKCTKCEKPIRETGVTYKTEPFHKECLLCAKCAKQLSGQKFTQNEKNGELYCVDCHMELFAKTCVACQKPICDYQSEYVVFEDQQWHNECFNCAKCAKSLVGQGFLMESNNTICPDCDKR